MSRDTEPFEVDIGTPWRAAKALIAQFVPVPERTAGSLVAMSILTCGAMIATAIYQLDCTIRRRP